MGKRATDKTRRGGTGAPSGEGVKGAPAAVACGGFLGAVLGSAKPRGPGVEECLCLASLVAEEMLDWGGQRVEETVRRTREETRETGGERRDPEGYDSLGLLVLGDFRMWAGSWSAAAKMSVLGLLSGGLYHRHPIVRTLYKISATLDRFDLGVGDLLDEASVRDQAQAAGNAKARGKAARAVMELSEELVLECAIVDLLCESLREHLPVGALEAAAGIPKGLAHAKSRPDTPVVPSPTKMAEAGRALEFRRNGRSSHERLDAEAAVVSLLAHQPALAAEHRMEAERRRQGTGPLSRHAPFLGTRLGDESLDLGEEIRRLGSEFDEAFCWARASRAAGALF